MSLPVRHIVLLGLMGVGKTSVGRALAASLGRPLSDSDEIITRRCGATVRELNERLGTEGMHRLEAEHLLDALAEPGLLVIAAAASVVDDAACCGALRAPGSFSVWLRGTPHLLAGRFAGGPHRPRLAAEPEALFRRQMAARSRRFAELAQLTVDVDGRPVAEIVEEVRRTLDSASI